MSRLDSNSPALSCLPRRRFLKALTAAPLAAVAVPEPGQPFSDPSMPNIRDRRFAKVDRMIRKINETCIAQSEASAHEGELNDEGDDVYEVASEKWFAAQEALVKYADKVASNPAPTIADGLILAKIADFHIVDQGEHLDIHDHERSVPQALRAMLLAHGIAPTEQTAKTIGQAELDARIASEPPKPDYPPCGANAGNIIIRIRAHGEAKKAALCFEGSLSDDSPHMRRAEATTDRRNVELEALRDEILSGLNKPYDAQNQDRTYSLHPVEEFAVLFELIDAMDAWLWSDAPKSNATPVLRMLHDIATCRSDYYIEQAQRWNASQGGANV